MSPNLLNDYESSSVRLERECKNSTFLSDVRSDNSYDYYNTIDYVTRVKNYDNQFASSIGSLFNSYDRQGGLDSTVSTNFRKEK